MPFLSAPVHGPRAIAWKACVCDLRRLVIAKHLDWAGTLCGMRAKRAGKPQLPKRPICGDGHREVTADISERVAPLIMMMRGTVKPRV